MTPLTLGGLSLLLLASLLLIGSSPPRGVHALTDPPNDWIVDVDSSINAICTKPTHLVSDSAGVLYTQFEDAACYKTYRKVPGGTWTHIAGTGAEPTTAGAMVTTATGTSALLPTSPFAWFGGPPGDERVFYSGIKITNPYYIYSMELTSGNFGITVMVGNGVAGSCSSGTVATPGASPSSRVDVPQQGYYRVTDGTIYVPVVGCGTIGQLSLTATYNFEIEFIGTTSAAAMTNTAGTNDPAAIGGGATKTILSQPSALVFNSAETEMYISCDTQLLKATVSTRVTTAILGKNLGVTTDGAAAGGIGAAANFGRNYGIMDWVDSNQDTLFFVAFDPASGPTFNLFAADISTAELRVYSSHRIGPGGSGTTSGPLSKSIVGATDGRIAGPNWEFDPTRPAPERMTFCTLFDFVCGYLTRATRTRTETESMEEPTPAPPTPAPITPAPPTPQPTTPNPPPTPVPTTAAPTTTTTPVPSTTTTTTSPTTATISTSAPGTFTPADTGSTFSSSRSGTDVDFSPPDGAAGPAAAQAQSQGLSGGERAGIGIGVTLAILAVAGVVGFALWKFKFSRKTNDLDAKGKGTGGEEKYKSVSPQETSMFA